MQSNRADSSSPSVSNAKVTKEEERKEELGIKGDGRLDLFPPYKISNEVIGKGAFGIVYLGFNLNNTELIAVKELALTKYRSDSDSEEKKMQRIEKLVSPYSFNYFVYTYMHMYIFKPTLYIATYICSMYIFSSKSMVVLKCNKN